MMTHLDGNHMEATTKKILLASNSPRRRELLGMIQPSFEIAHIKDIDETYPSSMCPTEIPQYLSMLKANAYKDSIKDDEIILTADTVVICDDKVLGKPKNAEDAANMLKMLSNRTHTVVTGVTILSNKKSDTFSEITEVSFGQLTDKEISDYIASFKPYDKAGAYGIQEWIGCIGITGIKGCFYNVMGLPLHTLYHHLLRF